MKCRKVVYDESNEKYDVVWFGSSGTIKKLECAGKTIEITPTSGEVKISPVVYNQICEINYINNSGKPIQVQILDQNLQTIHAEFISITKPSFGIYIPLGVNELTIIGKTFDGGILKDLEDPFSVKTLDYYSNNAIFWDATKQSYAEYQEGVASSLIQRLSVIKGELWYQINYGLPLFDKIKSKGIYDSTIIGIITNHPDVTDIEEFNSYVEKNVYYFNAKINTIYKESLELSSNYNL